MKITCILGSPRLQGNSAALTQHFLKQFDASGAEIQTFALNKLNYKGCQGCLACKRSLETCVLQDDLTEILDEVSRSDLLVLSSSVYWADVSSQLKGLIDRFYSYYVPDFVTNPNKTRLQAGKSLVMVLAQAHPDQEMFADIFPKYDRLLQTHGFHHNYQIRACGVFAPDDVAQQHDALEQAEKTAHKILERHS